MGRYFLMTLSVVLLCCSCSVQQKRGSEGVAPTVARVSDDNFRQYLLESGYVRPYKGGMKGFGLWVSRKEVVESTAGGRALQLIDCHKKDIKSLDGIELFGNLKVLICSENPIRSIDLSHNPQLMQFYAIEVPLRSLDVSRNTKLKLLQSSFSRLRSLDVSHNPELEELLCIFAPDIKTIDLSGNPELQVLYIRGTSIRTVDLHHNLQFRMLHALDTPLETIVITPQHNVDSIQASVEDGVRIIVEDCP